MADAAQTLTKAVFLLLWATVLAATPALAASVPLELSDIIAIARGQAPGVALVAARLREAKAGKVGTRLPAFTNPALSLTAGPGYSRPPKADFEFMLSLQWPLDFTHGRTGRGQVADASIEQAKAAYAEAVREEVLAAVSLAIQIAVAKERYTLCAKRVENDRELLRIAYVRHNAGTAADSDVELAKIALAQSEVLENYALAEQKGHTVSLQFLLRTPFDEELAVEPNFLAPLLSQSPQRSGSESLALQTFVDRRPDVRRAAATNRAAQADVRLQDSLGVPLPSVTIASGRGSEYQLSAGIAAPIPIYQRNQTARSISQAHEKTTCLAAEISKKAAEKQLRSQEITWESTARAFAVMDRAFADIMRAEYLALRGFELGQDSLTQVLLSRRETVQARSAYLDAKAAAAHALMSLQVSEGRFDER